MQRAGVGEGRQRPRGGCQTFGVISDCFLGDSLPRVAGRAFHAPARSDRERVLKKGVEHEDDEEEDSDGAQTSQDSMPCIHVTFSFWHELVWTDDDDWTEPAPHVTGTCARRADPVGRVRIGTPPRCSTRPSYVHRPSPCRRGRGEASVHGHTCAAAGPLRDGAAGECGADPVLSWSMVHGTAAPAARHCS